MSNYFIVNATTRMIWADWPVPESQVYDYSEHGGYKAYVEKYNSRPRFPYSTELNWRDGQRVQEHVDFVLLVTMSGGKETTEVIPLPPKQGIAETFRQLREIGSAWDDCICVCRGLMKDNPCDVNCKEFHDESLPNEFSKRPPLPSKDKEENKFGEVIAELQKEFKDDFNDWDKEEKTEREGASILPEGDGWRKELAGYLGYTSFEQLDTAERSIAEWMIKNALK